ncbi:hypothetical protein [Acidilobus sp.]|uniref:hypothetical protein n=1 Tax=Acidilobus sp. TaxID=1872109 RepID=UPI003D005124
MLLSLMATFYAVLSENFSNRWTAFIIVTSTLAIISVRFLVPDLADRYYITDFEDSFSHMFRAMYIAEYGHLTPWPDFMWFNRSLWFTLAEAILVLWGHPAWFKDPPFYFVIKWIPELMSLLMAPATYLLARSLGLSRKAAATAIPLSIILWSDIPESVSDHYGTVTFTIAAAAFVLALRERDRRSLAMLLVATLAAVYTHELIAALAGVAFFGGGLLYLMFPGKSNSRTFTAKALLTVTAAYLIMGVYDSYGFVQQGIHYYWSLTISTLRRLTYHAPQLIYQATVRAMPSYHAAVEVKAAALIAELLIPFAIAAALSLRRPEHRALTGALGLSGLVGAALTLGLGAVGWADRVPLMFIGVLAVILASLVEVKSHRKAAVAAALASVIVLTPLCLYASFVGYPAVAFPEVGWDLGIWWIVTSNGRPALTSNFTAAVPGELAPDAVVAYPLPPLPAGEWCNETLSEGWFKPGYMGFYYQPYSVYSAYSSCSDYPMLYSNVLLAKYNNSVVVNAPVGFLALMR